MLLPPVPVSRKYLFAGNAVAVNVWVANSLATSPKSCALTRKIWFEPVVICAQLSVFPDLVMFEFDTTTEPDEFTTSAKYEGAW